MTGSRGNTRHVCAISRGSAEQGNKGQLGSFAQFLRIVQIKVAEDQLGMSS